MKKFIGGLIFIINSLYFFNKKPLFNLERLFIFKKTS